MKKVAFKVITMIISAFYFLLSAYAVYAMITATQRNFSVLYAIPFLAAFILYILNLIFVGKRVQKSIIGLTIAALAVALLPATSFCLLLSPLIIPTMPIEMLIFTFVPASVSLLYLIYVLFFFRESTKHKHDGK